jgi:hypothetical protein
MPSAAAFLAAIAPAPAGVGATASGGQDEAALAFAAALAQVSQGGSGRGAPAHESAPQMSATPPQPGLLRTARHAALTLDTLKVEAEPATADLAPALADGAAFPAPPVPSTGEPSADAEPAVEETPAQVDAVSEDASVTPPPTTTPQAPVAVPPTPAQVETAANEGLEGAPAKVGPVVASETVNTADIPAPVAPVGNDEIAPEPAPAPILTTASGLTETEIVSAAPKASGAGETPAVPMAAAPVPSRGASPTASGSEAASAAAQPTPAPIKAEPVSPANDKAPLPAAAPVQALDTRDAALNIPPSQTGSVAGSVVVKARTVAPEIAQEAASASPKDKTLSKAQAAVSPNTPPLATPATIAQTPSKAVVAPAAIPVKEIPEDGDEPVTPMTETAEAAGEVKTAKADAAPSTPRLEVPAPPRPLRDPPRIHDRVAAVSQEAARTTTDADQAGATTAAAQPAAQPAATGGSQAATTMPQIAMSDASAPLQAAPAISDASQSPLDAPVETARSPESTAASTSRDLSFSQLSRATIETTAHLAATIARKLEGRSTRFDMVLTPEDLGRVDVSLEIDSDGQLAARLAFDNPAAAADLRSRVDELRRQLQDAGFQVTSESLDFSQRDPSSGGGAFDRQQQRNALFAGGSRLAAQADLAAAPPVGAWTNHSLTPDRVDVRV